MGTHGRLRDWISKKTLPVDGVRILVFDEADEMLKASGVLLRAGCYRKQEHAERGTGAGGGEMGEW